MQIFNYIQGVQHNLIGDISDNGTALFSGGEDAEMPIADSSYRFSEIMGDDNCIINFSLPVFYEFPIGCFIIVDYTAYTLLELGQVTKQNERWYDYTLTFESPAKQLSRYKFRNYVDGRLNFTITAQPQEFLDHICRNMNMDGRDSGWTVGDCIVSSEKTQSFSHNTVADALNSVAQLFETEWEIVGKRISLRKIEYNKTNPLTLSYGMGNGFKSGITRQLSDEKAVDVLWVVGGDRNIDGRKYTYRKDGEVYHANTLRLPRNSRFVYIPSNGEPDASGKIDRGQLFTLAEWNAKSAAERGAYAEFMAVKTDKDGFGVERETRINNGYEESLEATDIYPHKVLQVAKAECVDAENRFWDITVKTADGSPIPDYNECLIGGVTVTTVFNSGMLSGKEFNIANQGTDENPKCYDPALRIFKIQPTEIDGIVMPDLPTENDPEYGESGLPFGTGYVPHINDEFGIFHVFLPNQYVEEAERELLLTACEYLWKHGEVEVEFNGTVDGIWAKDNWDSIFPYIKLGGYIRFYDKHILGGADGKLMRILNIKQYINNPHSPEITLSNSSVSQGVSSEIKKIPQNQVYALAEIDKQVAYTKRSFEDTKDTQKMLEEAFVNQGDYFTNSITPVSVETMQMIVGSEDLQFMFGSATTTTVSGRKKVTRFDEFNYNPTYSNGQLVCNRVHMRHYSYTSHKGEITAATDAVFPYWEIAARTFAVANPNQSYYLYAVCAKTATTTNNLGYLNEGNAFALETAPHAHTNDKYYFLVGVLNREKDGTRSFASLYGYTEVLGNRVTTGRIVSADGQTWFDLTTGEIRTNKSIKFSWQGNEQDLADAMSRVSNSATAANTLAATVQNNLENLQIGGRNLFGLYSDCSRIDGFTSQSNISVDTANKCVKMIGAADKSCYFYSSIPFYPKANQIMTFSCDVKIENIVNRASNFMCQFYYSGQYINGGSTWYGIREVLSTYLDGVKQATKSLRFSDIIHDTKWHRMAVVAQFYNVAYDANLPPAIYLRGATGTMWIKNVKYEEGEVPTAWSPAPEDAETNISNVKTKIDNMNGDTIFSVVEKKAMRPEWQQIQGAANTTAAADASGLYKKAIAAVSGTTVSTTAITNAYNVLKSYLNTLKLYTSEDTSGFNQTNIGNLFKAYYTAQTALYDDLADYNADIAKQQAELANKLAEASQLVSQGYMLYRDPEFHEGSNSVKVYNNQGNGKVTHARITDSTAPNSATNADKGSAHYVIRITTSGTASPYCGGFYFGNMSRANAVFVYYIRAKIPVGYYIAYAYNAHGTGAQQIWCTTQDGDNTYRDYVIINRCGASGTFSSVGFFYLIPKSGYSATSVTWYVAYATCYDCTAFESLKQAFANSTDITGGVVLSNVIQVRNNNNAITAGMSGMNPNGVGKNPRFWAGGDFVTATRAASEAGSDVHNTNLPILLLDGGYNSNIGIFKVLQDAIAVMRAGQVVRISTNAYRTEENTYSPLSPTTRTLSSASFSWTSTSNYSDNKSWSVGTFPKDGTYTVTVPSTTVKGVLNENRRVFGAYQSGRTNQVKLTVECAIYAGGQSKTIANSSTTVTLSYWQDGDSSGYAWSPSTSLNISTSGATLYNVSAKAGDTVVFKATISVSVTAGQQQLVSRNNSFTLTNSLTAKLAENKSCFILANGGMSIAYNSDNYMKVDISDNYGKFDYRGTYFKINGADYARLVGKTVQVGSGYIRLYRIGNLVSCKCGGIPKANLGTSYIPVGFRPVVNADFMAYCENVNTVLYSATVTTSGTVTCSALPNNKTVWGEMTYISEDTYPS